MDSEDVVDDFEVNDSVPNSMSDQKINSGSYAICLKWHFFEEIMISTKQVKINHERVFTRSPEFTVLKHASVACDVIFSRMHTKETSILM